MRTKSSSTAHSPDYSSNFCAPIPLPPRGTVQTSMNIEGADHGEQQCIPQLGTVPGAWRAREGPAFWDAARAAADVDDGLLHDAGNLIGAVGLYCDLLSMPHVLRPEHRHYADELRLLGERSAAMIEQLIERRIGEWGEASALLASSAQPQPQRPDAAPSASRPAKGALGLRPAVERCAGLLRGIAGKQAVQFLYGEAAALPVRVPADSVERILINLVRNAAAALAPIRGGIRIGVGLLPGNGDGIMRPWPFQRVRLTVEDFGRGMAPEEVNSFSQRAPWGPAPRDRLSRGARTGRSLRRRALGDEPAGAGYARGDGVAGRAARGADAARS